MLELVEFYRDKVVFLTGHSGFKGSWMSLMLHELGSKVIGYSLDPKNENDLFVQAEVSKFVIDIRGDVLDKKHLEKVIFHYRPEIVFHFAAQPLVIESYNDPVHTWNVNLIGTLNLLEVVRKASFIKSVVIITTDKVYENQEKLGGYLETDSLGGHDPYSASKAAVELLVQSYRKSYFSKNDSQTKIITVRAGNVLGGGDWGENRLIPDYYRAYNSGQDFTLRNKDAVRPWQHVLDVNYAYLVLNKNISNLKDRDGIAFNVSNSTGNVKTTGDIIKILNKSNRVKIKYVETSQYKETNYLLINSSKIFELFGLENKISTEQCLNYVKEYYENPRDIKIIDVVLLQIKDYFNRVRL